MSAMEWVCDIIQHELGLANGRVVLWNQKIMMPNDPGLFVIVQAVSCKPFGSSRRYDSASGLSEVQGVNMQATLSIDILSRGEDAPNRKEEVLFALGSTYAEQMMERHGFLIARLSNGFVNLSQEDGAAIPYRFNISVNVQYSVRKQKQVDYYDTFADVDVKTDP